MFISRDFSSQSTLLEMTWLIRIFSFTVPIGIDILNYWKIILAADTKISTPEMEYTWNYI